jgi:hypothetical protein
MCVCLLQGPSQLNSSAILIQALSCRRLPCPMPTKCSQSPCSITGIVLVLAHTFQFRLARVAFGCLRLRLTHGSRRQLNA